MIYHFLFMIQILMGDGFEGPVYKLWKGVDRYTYNPPDEIQIHMG